MSDEIRAGDEFEIKVKVVKVQNAVAVVAVVSGGQQLGREPTRDVFWKSELLAGRRVPRPILAKGTQGETK